ncbi:helix-turn-helix domain-containing protein [Breoghania sp. L-A4]|uniref:helix-turn-helix domain-containing protein n=1 Tax=Breoghania sp. L-A4 TaxID=2304600 RepID=UPI002110D860|nr:helix-turn-helix domain-containing protein [Breoghania sp. L-A4]
MGGTQISTFGAVRSLQRGLEVLQAINRHNGLKAADVAKVVGIPRPTAYRLLETLESMELVVRGPSEDTWRPTLHTKSLSSGFRDEDWVAQIAVPEMVKLGRQVLWPLDLVVFRNYRMEVRESTHNISPFSVDHGMVGRGLPVLDTASGRVYLALCGDNEREQILAGLEAELGVPQPFYLEDGPLDQILDRIHELGVGYRMTGVNAKTMSISAAISCHGQPVAFLTMIWISSALKFDKAIELYREPLLDTAKAISEPLSRQLAQNTDL